MASLEKLTLVDPEIKTIKGISKNLKVLKLRSSYAKKIELTGENNNLILDLGSSKAQPLSKNRRRTRNLLLTGSEEDELISGTKHHIKGLEYLSEDNIIGLTRR